MAKKKTTVIYPNTRKHLLICLGCLAVAVGGIVALIVGLIPNDFRIGVILLSVVLGIAGVLAGAWVVVPSRIILKDKHLVLLSITSQVRAQIPYANIAEVRLHHTGEGDLEVEVVGIDVVKAKAKDTWWPRSFSGHTYDVEIHDDWAKPPKAIVRLIQNQIDRLYDGIGQAK